MFGLLRHPATLRPIVNSSGTNMVLNLKHFNYCTTSLLLHEHPFYVIIIIHPQLENAFFQPFLQMAISSALLTCFHSMFLHMSQLTCI